MAEQKNYVLVADIGGTNARLGVAALSPQAPIDSIEHFKVVPCADYPNLGALLDSYISSLPEPLRSDTVHLACMAIAGPIRKESSGGETGAITNSGWQVDSEALAQRFHWQGVRLLNDFSALAYSVPYLPKSELVRLHQGQAAPHAPISVIGPGTGFGVALLVPEMLGQQERWHVIATEGGHASYAPTTRREAQLCDYLGGFERHLAVENVLSGSGIAAIYGALSALSGDCAGGDTDAEHIPAPHEISQRALAGTDALCVETMTIFCEILGSIAGNIALTHGATGGVYLGGGILPKIQSMLLKSHFFERFSRKGVMSAYVERLPVYLIDSPHAALVGAAQWYAHHAMKP